jgi:hypothetical protein
MFEAEDRGQMVLRVWGSFVVGLIVVALAGGAYEAVTGGAFDPALVIGAAFLGGFVYAIPLLVIAAVAAFLLAERIARRPASWSGGATVIATVLVFFLYPIGMWQVALAVCAASSVILCVWLRRRPLGHT